MKSFFENFPTEEPYAFRKQLEEIHAPDRRNPERPTLPGEFEITDRWKIRLPENAGKFLRDAAEDLKDYFHSSMGVDLEIHSGAPRKYEIELAAGAPGLSVKRSFIFHAEAEGIRIHGFDERGTAMGCYYLEDLLNLRENPSLKPIAGIKKEPLLSPRIIHSGYGKTLFTPRYLRRIAHYGFDSIALYTNLEGKLDFPSLFRDTAEAGLDIYFYSKYPNDLHPSDPEAGAYYQSTYGELFKRYPSARGIILVGESINFPSRDPNVMPRRSNHFLRPSSAGWPCRDYPELLTVIRDSIRAVSPDAEIVFWTYNWGWAPEEERIKLIENLPEGITLNVNFALHDNVKVGETLESALDYTLGCTGPSAVFRSEAAAAARRNIRLYSMTNTAGKTWDFGVTPHIPAYFQWMNRIRAILEAQRKWGLSGLLESHSYGWQPSVASELAKWMFWSNAPAEESIMNAIALRDSSKEAAELLAAAWRKCSDGVEGYPTPIEDQYGPSRVGPAYPLLFSPDMIRTHYIKFRSYPRIDQDIVFHWFRPVENPYGGECAPWRVPVEITYLAGRIRLWEEGMELLQQVLELIPDHKKRNLLREFALVSFIRNTLRTTRNVKRWWLLNSRLVIEADIARAEELLSEMRTLVAEETRNVEETLPLVRFDSRLGFECSMGYAGDEWHLNWKLDLLRQLVDKDIPEYEAMLERKRTEGRSGS